jgi:cbb3-type cytochrome oxidase subunit 3
MLKGFYFPAFFFTWSHSACFPSVGWVKYEVLLSAVYAIFVVLLYAFFVCFAYFFFVPCCLKNASKHITDQKNGIFRRAVSCVAFEVIWN